MKLILTGGFLGSGKTTAIQQACNLLRQENKKVAVVTNDQGEQLVDSKFIEGLSIPVKEVVKGCFCCNYNMLLQNIYAFNKEINPDVIFAESVGSCTDIVATIAKPLAEMHPEFSLSISVFVDVSLLHSLITGTSSFIDDSVRYIFKKQMEEADILILNKIDLLNAAQLDEVRRAIEQAYPSKKILLQNSFDKQNIEQWIEWFNKTFSFDRKSLDIDYNIYGEGEAKLAWLDAVLDIKTKKMSAAKAASVFAEVMYQNIAAQKLIIGHLKYLINDGKNNFKINYTTTSKEQKIFLVDSTSIKASIIVNARVQTTPEILQQILQDSIAEAALQTNSEIKIKSLSAFKPGFPRPTYRIAN
jgi:Ni2+-binding GTPase involved in maturation of urease and hydrogenase